MVRTASYLVAPFAILVALAFVPAAPAQSFGQHSTKAGLLKSLDSLGYRYQVMENGSILVNVPTENGKSYPVVMWPEEKDENGGYRVVMAPVARFQGSTPVRADSAIKELNGKLKFGKLIKLNSKDGSTTVVLAMIIRDGASAQQIGAILRYLAVFGNDLSDGFKAANLA